MMRPVVLPDPVFGRPFCSFLQTRKRAANSVRGYESACGPTVDLLDFRINYELDQTNYMANCPEIIAEHEAYHHPSPTCCGTP